MKMKILIVAIIIVLISGIYLGFQKILPALRIGGEIDSAVKHPVYPSALQQLRREGLPTSIADYVREEPPTGKNAALIYHQLGRYEGDLEEKEVYRLASSVPYNASDSMKIKQFVQSHSRIIGLAHRAVSKPDYYVYHKPSGDPSSILFPEFKQMRRTTRLLIIESQSMVRASNGIPAVQNLSLAFQPGKHATKEFSLMAWMVSSACNTMAFTGLQHIMTTTHGDAATAQAVKKSVEKSYTQQSLSNALKSEMAFELSDIEYIRNNDGMTFDNGNSILKTYNSYTKAQQNALMDMNGVSIITLFHPAVVYSDLPYPNAFQILKPIDDNFRKATGPGVMIASIFCPVTSKIIAVRARETATANVTLAAADVFIYKSKHGAFPDRLEQAVVNVPQDPFDLKPLRYRKEGKGFLIYSVGETLKYDGRYLKDDKTIIPATKPGGQSQTIKEIVYRYSGK